MKRRNLAFGGAAALAGLAGIGVAWQKYQPHGSLSDMSSSTTADGGVGPAQAFWTMSFDTPQGGQLATSSLKGQPLLVNFWATWCPPCVDELPLLDSFYQRHKAKGWTVLGLAVDQPSAVNKWLQAKPLSFPVGMAGLGGTDLSKQLGNRSGSLPFSVVFGAAGDVLHRKIGKVSEDDLMAWAQMK